MKSIYLRNFLVIAATIFIGLLLIVVSLLGIGKSYICEEYRLNMENSAEELARSAYAISESSSLSNWNLSMSLTAVAEATGNSILITDRNGVVACCSDEELICAHIGRAVSREVMEELKTGSSLGKETDLGGLREQPMLTVAKPVKNSFGEIKGYVFVSVLISDVLSTWRPFVWIVAVIFSAIFLCLLIFSFWYSKNMSRPLDEIAAASRMFARGDFSVRVEQRSDPTDEMGALIDSFNKMADSLESAENRRTEFISNISHELRTPMTTISGFADGILDGTIPPEEEKKYLISIRDETRRLARLVRSMLDASRMQSMSSDPGRRSDFDLSELILQILLSFETRATEKKLDVDPELPDGHIMVHADKDAITQVIYNLLDNAVKFSKQGGCITLKLYTESGKAYTCIKDEGETIPTEDLPFIFDRFHKSDRSRSLDKDGVGLGLYLVKTIINGHDEDIAVKSENGATEFVFTLPLMEKEK